MEGWDKASKGPMPLLFTPNIREVIDLDTVNQRATLRIDYCCDYIDDGALEVDESLPEGYRIKEGHFSPQIRIHNLIEALAEPQETFWVSFIGPRVCVSVYFTQLAVVYCPMNLLEFPFDCQTIPLEFMSDSFSSEHIEFRVRMASDPVQDLDSGVFLDKQLAQDSFPAFRFTGVSISLRIRDYAHLRHYSYCSKYGLLTLNVQCSRDPHYYIYRIVLMQLMVSILKMMTSLIPLEDYNTKMGWDGSLFLTLVAFSFVIAQEVPKVSYTTRIDKLVISASVLMIVDILVELVLAFLANTAIPDQASLLDAVDTWRAIFYLVLLTACTAWFFLPMHTHRAAGNTK
jgi:hypothetical protein